MASIIEQKNLVYRHRRVDNNKIFYVGITNNKRRPFESKTRNNVWKKIVNKTDYIVEIIATDLSREDANELEMFLVSLYGRIDLRTGPLANLTDGGDGIINSPERNKKISERLLGVKRNEDFKKKCRARQIGILRTTSTKLKMSDSQKVRHSTKPRSKHYLLDLQTGIYYTFKEAIKTYGIEYTTLWKYVFNKRKNKTNLILS